MAVIGIDLDGVLFDFSARFADACRVRYGKPNTNIADNWNMTNFGSKEELDNVWSDVRMTANFWETVPVEPGVNRGLVQAVDALHTVYFPTARAHTIGRATGKQTARAIHKNFDIQYPTVFVSNEKGPMATALRYDYFIDDKPSNCIDIKNALPNCKVFLRTLPHNEDFASFAPLDIPRVSGFNEFAEIVLGGGR